MTLYIIDFFNVTNNYLFLAFMGINKISILAVAIFFVFFLLLKKYYCDYINFVLAKKVKKTRQPLNYFLILKH